MTIDSELQTLEFHRSFDLPKPLTFSSSDDAFSWLKHLSPRSGNSASQFRRFLSQCVDGVEVFRMSDDEALRQLANLLYKRQIVVLRKIRFTSSGTSEPKEEVGPAFPIPNRKRAAINATRSKTWISIVLNDLNDSDGNPAAGEQYRIELPDGRLVEGSLDRMGTAAVSGIDPGQCRVSFPRLAGSVWDPAGGGSE